MIHSDDAIRQVDPIQIVNCKNSRPLIFIAEKSEAFRLTSVLIPDKSQVHYLSILREYNSEIALGQPEIKPSYINISTMSIVLMPAGLPRVSSLEICLIELLDCKCAIHLYYIFIL